MKKIVLFILFCFFYCISSYAIYSNMDFQPCDKVELKDGNTFSVRIIKITTDSIFMKPCFRENAKTLIFAMENVEKIKFLVSNSQIEDKKAKRNRRDEISKSSAQLSQSSLLNGVVIGNIAFVLGLLTFIFLPISPFLSFAIFLILGLVIAAIIYPDKVNAIFGILVGFGIAYIIIWLITRP